MSVQCVFAAQRVGLPVAAAGYVATVDGNFLGDFEPTAKDVVLGGREFRLLLWWQGWNGILESRGRDGDYSFGSVVSVTVRCECVCVCECLCG